MKPKNILSGLKAQKTKLLNTPVTSPKQFENIQKRLDIVEFKIKFVEQLAKAGENNDKI